MKEVSQSQEFNKIYRFVCALAFVPDDDMLKVISDVLHPYMDQVEENLSPAAIDWCEYFASTYIGGSNARTGR